MWNFAENVNFGKHVLPSLEIRVTKGGPQANCPQSLVRPHKMLRPRVQIAFENIGSFQYKIIKTKSGSETNKQQIEDPQFLNTRSEMSSTISVGWLVR